MVKRQAVDYVNSMLQRGYASDSIRQAMLKYGYSNRDFEEALKEVYSPGETVDTGSSKAVILVMVSITMAALIFAYFYFGDGEVAKMPGLSLRTASPTVEAGKEISFFEQFSNLDQSRLNGAKLSHEIVESGTGRIVAQKSETMASNDVNPVQARIVIPLDAQAGDYAIRATLQYGNRKAVATAPIKIISPAAVTGGRNPSGQKIATPSCDDLDPCTIDSIGNGICSHSRIIPCCGNKECETGETQNCGEDCPNGNPPPEITPEILERIKEISKSDPQKGLVECRKVEVPDIRDTCISNIGEVQLDKYYCTMAGSARIRDNCFSNIAKLKKDNSLCDEISTDPRKDSCYMGFVLDEKDYSVCEKVTNRNLRQSCDSLRQLNALSQ